MVAHFFSTHSALQYKHSVLGYRLKEKLQNFKEEKAVEKEDDDFNSNCQSQNSVSNKYNHCHSENINHPTPLKPCPSLLIRLFGLLVRKML